MKSSDHHDDAPPDVPPDASRDASPDTSFDDSGGQDSGEQDGGHTSFGFRTVRTGEKSRLVRGVFDSVADRYDLMNDLMSGGIHRVWKSILIDRINPRPGETLLDMAGGTGDIARRFVARGEARRAAPAGGSSDGAAPSKDAPTGKGAPTGAIICDINHEMLKAGVPRDAHMQPAGATTGPSTLFRICGDAEHVPLPDRCVDVYTIAFGIRNVTHIERALAEAHRVLKFGGRFACLEFSHPVTELLQHLYDRYSFAVIPQLGEWVANDRDSYQYLVESIRRFPVQPAFEAMVRDAGFSRTSYENLTGGVAAIHTGWRL